MLLGSRETPCISNTKRVTDFMGYGTYLSFTRGENIQLIAVRVAFKSIKYL